MLDFIKHKKVTYLFYMFISSVVKMTFYNQKLRMFLLDYLFIKHNLQQIIYNLPYGVCPFLLLKVPIFNVHWSKKNIF